MPSEIDVVQNVRPQSYLLIGENDTNLVKPQTVKPKSARNSSFNTFSQSNLHDRLYAESHNQKLRKDQRQIEAMNEMRQKEEAECTF